MSSGLDVKFTSDASAFEAAYEKMKRYNQELQTQLQNVHKETRNWHEQEVKGEQEREHWIKGSISNLGELAIGYFSVQAAIGYMSKALEHYNQVQEKSRKQADDINKQVVSAAVATGDLQNADRIKAFAQSAAASGQVNQADAMTIYREASQANPGASFERKTAIARSLLPQRAILNDDELGDYAKVAGKNSKLFGDKTSAGEIADITLAMREMAGMRFNELKDRDFDKGAYKLGAGGAMSKEEGLAFAVSAVVNNQEAGIIERFANKIFDQMDKKQITPGMTAQQRSNTRLENQYAKMTPAQRYEALRTDDKMAKAVLDSDFLNFKQLQQDVPRITEHLKMASAPGDYSSGRVREAGTQAVVQERTQKNRIGAIQSDALSDQEIRAGAVQRMSDRINAAVDKNNPWGPDILYRISPTEIDIRGASDPLTIAPLFTKAAGTGWSEEDKNQIIKEERDLVTKQLEAAKAMKEAADALKANPAGAVPAKPLNVRADKEGR